ncbi:recombinase family protein [Cyanobium sp. ATX 6E8]|uniref:recombinase family protein n=1 Tax=Cyanobium sp. ATX 6E8 TaxID=2823701 RepID=UPI0020CC1B0F|nr:recombinase family protein [Cyanobium sp. ATX 6E8]MCP9940974.1 recombinase family protein [Cyanobium sp. ATX 6E8]
MVLAVPYSRVSSAGQTSGLGLERQAADPAAYCSARGWILYDGPGYSDEGVSAFGGKNLREGELGRFLADAKAGRFGVEPIALLIEDLDRFSRAMPLAVLPVLIDDLLNAGMTISVMSKGRDLSRESIKASSMELHELLFWMSASHDFSQRLSRRISHVHQAKRERIRDGKPVTPSNAPAWIDLDANGQWVLNDYAAVIRRVAAMAAEDFGCHAIASTLNREGVPSPGQYRRDQWAAHAQRRSTNAYKPVAWSGASVKQVLSSPALIGNRQIVTPGHKQQIREWQEQCALLRRQGVAEGELPKHPARTYEAPQRGYYPAVITESEQAAILVALKRRQPACMGQVSKVRWIGAGLTFCVCGEPIGAVCSMRKGEATYWLRCKGRTNGKGCSQPGIKLKDAQAALLTRLGADTFLAMFDEQQGGERTTALALAITKKSSAQATVDQLVAGIAAGEQAMAAEADPSVLGVLARRQAQQEQRLSEAMADLRDAQAEVQQLQSMPGGRVIAAEAQDQISELLRFFAAGADTVEDRRAVQHHFRRMGLTVHLNGDDAQLGLQVGSSSQIDWRPLARVARRTALAQGIANPPSAWDQPGIGAGIVTRDGELLVVPMPGEPPADPAAAGYDQGLEDGRRLLGLASEEQR